MALKYLKEHEVKNTGGSKTLFLTEALNLLDLDFNDKVLVKVEDGKIIIEKVEKKAEKYG